MPMHCQFFMWLICLFEYDYCFILHALITRCVILSAACFTSLVIMTITFFYFYQQIVLESVLLQVFIYLELFLKKIYRKTITTNSIVNKI